MTSQPHQVIEAGQPRAQVTMHGVRERSTSTVTPDGVRVELGDEQQTRVIHSQPPVRPFLQQPGTEPAQAPPQPTNVQQAPTTADRLKEARRRHTELLSRASAAELEAEALAETIAMLQEQAHREQGDRDELATIQAQREQLEKDRAELAARAAQVVDRGELDAARAELAAERKAFEEQKAALAARQPADLGQLVPPASTEVQQTENLTPPSSAESDPTE